LTDLFHPAGAHDRLRDITVYKAEINLAFNGEWQAVLQVGKNPCFYECYEVFVSVKMFTFGFT